jgi:hypothetical protein
MTVPDSSCIFGLFAAMVVAIPCLAIGGCTPESVGNAHGAATPEELVKKYEEAHRQKSVDKLRDLLAWESPEVRGRRREDLEALMTELFDMDLEKVEYVAGPQPDPVKGGYVYYIRRRPGKDRQFPGVVGSVYGKLVLVGSVGTGAEKRPVRLDPSYIVMQSLNRYYIDIHPFVLEDAVTSMRTGKPSGSEPIPFNVDPRTVK